MTDPQYRAYEMHRMRRSLLTRDNRIRELEAELEVARNIVRSLSERVAMQSEFLAKAAMRVDPSHGATATSDAVGYARVEDAS